MKISETNVPGYERVVRGVDRASGYEGIVAVHSTVLGPAVGGTRYWRYPTSEEALSDVLRLARGMTYKSALAGLPCGGGKSVILRDGSQDREQLFRAHGRLVESLGGRYIAGEDVGTSPADMEFVRKETRYVAGLEGASGDPSPKTARGVFRAMQAAARHLWGREELSGKVVAIQGCGHVGYYLAGELHRAGARLVVTDVDAARVERAVAEFKAVAVEPERIYAVEADVFAPCALGGVLSDTTIPQLCMKLVVGAANNQLLEPSHGDLLDERGILYAPDYAANAGGVIWGCCMEMLGWDAARAMAKVDAIYDTILAILRMSRETDVPTYKAADRLAEERLAQK